MSDDLKYFYTLYKEWVDAGAPEMEPFSRHKGIRRNIQMVLPNDPEAAAKLVDEHQLRMVKTGVHLTQSFPGSHEAVSYEMVHGLCHLNTKRIAWITNAIKE